MGFERLVLPVNTTHLCICVCSVEFVPVMSSSSRKGDSERKKGKHKKKKSKRKRESERNDDDHKEVEPVEDYGGRLIPGAKILKLNLCDRVVVEPFRLNRWSDEGKLMGARKAGYCKLLYIPGVIKQQVLTVYGKFEANQTFGVPAKPL